MHLILRNVLDGCEDAFVLRAAELLFRPQRLTLHDGSLVAADEETVSGLGNKPLSPLVSMLGLPKAAEIDVLNDDNAASYWQRSDLFDMALDLTAGRRGIAALGEVIERWIAHLLGVAGGDRAARRAARRDARLVCRPRRRGHAHRRCACGTATRWTMPTRGRDRGALSADALPTLPTMLEKVRGEPVYLMAAMTTDKVLRLKPQNLLTGLPVRLLEAVS